MISVASPLITVYQGWEGYQTSLVNAIAPLSPEQLAFRPSPDLRSVGEIARHISCGRLNWFLRMHAPGSVELAERVPEWFHDQHGNRYIVEEAFPIESGSLVEWLDAAWRMVEATLTQWSIADLERTYPHTFQGTTYAVSYQWTIWRILSHDIHHGGQLSALLYLQGIEIPELGGLGGHLTELPLADEAKTAP
jgi:uncharacterized damage-inducible protein DinB